MSFIRKPSNSPYYYYYWSEGGQQKSTSLGTEIKEEAEVLKGDRDRARFCAANNLPDLKKPWVELRDEFMRNYLPGRTKTLYQEAIDEFERIVRPVRACVPVTDAENYIQTLRTEIRKKTGQPFGPATINIYLRDMKAIFKYALEKKYITESPFAKIKELDCPEKIVNFFHADQVRRLIQIARESWCDHAELLMLTYLFTGLRLGEAVKLRWEHVDFEFNRIATFSRKTKKARYKMLHPILRRALLAEPERTGYVFKGKKPNTHRNISATGHLFTKFYRRAGIEGVGGLQILRHTHLTYIATLMPIQDVQDQASHSDIRMTQRYLHKTPEQRQAFERLDYGLAVEAPVVDAEDRAAPQGLIEAGAGI